MVIVVPYHQDERLPGDLLPLPGHESAQVIDPELPQGDLWARLSALDETVADTAAAAVGPDIVTVVSGDCLLAVAALAGAQRSGSVAAVRRLRATGRVAVLHIACPWLRVADPSGRTALLGALLS